MSLDLVVLGNLLVDDVVFPDGSTRMGQPGGAALYAALGARLWGLDVGLASVQGSDYPEPALRALADRGVRLEGLRPLGRPGLRTWLLYEGARRRVVHRLDGPSHAEVSPSAAELPPAWRSARAFHLAPMPFDVQAGLVRELTGPGALVSLDPYAILRDAERGRWKALLQGIDALFFSEDEMELTRPATGSEAWTSLAGGRLRRLFYKRGERGGEAWDASEGRGAWSPRVDRVVDPTGAGDAFASGVLAGWLRGEPVARCLERGVVGASFAIGDWGAEGLLHASPEAAEARLVSWFGAPALVGSAG